MDKRRRRTHSCRFLIIPKDRSRPMRVQTQDMRRSTNIVTGLITIGRPQMFRRDIARWYDCDIIVREK